MQEKSQKNFIAGRKKACSIGKHTRNTEKASENYLVLFAMLLQGTETVV
jgi:hypothetical protein